jgi:lipoprotein LprG
MSLRSPVPVVLAGLLGGLVMLSGCGGGGSGSDEDPATALATAQHTLESTSGVTLSLRTDDLPDGVQGLESASGTVTDAPAYDGSLGVVTQLGSFSVPVKAVDGKVYAQIPLTPGWSEVDPADYGAPDPAQLISTESGVPSILAATITGTVPDSAVAAIIPGASGDFDATYALTSDNELRQVTLTGEFYSGHPANTYTLVLTDYGTSKDITAP